MPPFLSLRLSGAWESSASWRASRLFSWDGISTKMSDNVLDGIACPSGNWIPRERNHR